MTENGAKLRSTCTANNVVFPNKMNSTITSSRSELDLLLNFNENVLDFDSSIVSQAAKTKVMMFYYCCNLSHQAEFCRYFDFGGFSFEVYGIFVRKKISLLLCFIPQVESFFSELSNTIDDFAVPRYSPLKQNMFRIFS